jgi:hypothetical protein
MNSAGSSVPYRYSFRTLVFTAQHPRATHHTTRGKCVHFITLSSPLRTDSRAPAQLKP